jgi:hypothetical protein
MLSLFPRDLLIIFADFGLDFGPSVWNPLAVQTSRHYNLCRAHRDCGGWAVSANTISKLFTVIQLHPYGLAPKSLTKMKEVATRVVKGTFRYLTIEGHECIYTKLDQAIVTQNA